MKLIKLKHRIPRHKKGDSITEVFFEFFKNCFYAGTPIEIEREKDTEDYKYEKYVEELYREIELELKSTRDYSVFRKYYLRYKAAYSVRLRWWVYESFVDFLVSENKYEEAYEEWIVLREEEYEGWENGFTFRDSEIKMLMKFEKLLNKGVVNGYLIEKIAPKGSQLTKFGKRNISEIHKHIDIIIRETCGASFFSQFYTNYSFESKHKLKTHHYTYYEKYYTHNSVGKKEWEYLVSEEQLNLVNLFVQRYVNPHVLKSGKASLGFTIGAMSMEASRLLREAENSYREAIGAKKIGEAWISETELYYKVKSHFKEVEVIQHGRPDWLGRQHFDVWIPELNVALEYQGAQHDNPVEFFGGQKAFEQNQKRDQLKKEKCLKNGVRLIEVREGYNFEEVIDQINGK